MLWGVFQLLTTLLLNIQILTSNLKLQRGWKETFAQQGVEQFDEKWYNDVGDLLQH